MIFRSQPAAEVLLPDIEAWFDSEIGQELLSLEQQLLNDVIAPLKGMHLLEISIDGRQCLTEASAVQHRFSISPAIRLGSHRHSVISDHHELPLTSDVLDAVVLHHVLDFAASPHQVLRECARVLRPGGHLVIIGFNPRSLWGLYRSLKRKERERVPWRGHFLSHRRLQDWLALLELTELKSWTDGYTMPFSKAKWRDRTACVGRMLARTPAHNGSFLIMLARKDVAGMTPITPIWKRQLISFPMAKSTSGGHTRESR